MCIYVGNIEHSLITAKLTSGSTSEDSDSAKLHIRLLDYTNNRISFLIKQVNKEIIQINKSRPLGESQIAIGRGRGVWSKHPQICSILKTKTHNAAHKNLVVKCCIVNNFVYEFSNVTCDYVMVSFGRLDISILICTLVSHINLLNLSVNYY